MMRSYPRLWIKNFIRPPINERLGGYLSLYNPARRDTSLWKYTNIYSSYFLSFYWYLWSWTPKDIHHGWADQSNKIKTFYQVDSFGIGNIIITRRFRWEHILLEYNYLAMVLLSQTSVLPRVSIMPSNWWKQGIQVLGLFLQAPNNSTKPGIFPRLTL